MSATTCPTRTYQNQPRSGSKSNSNPICQKARNERNLNNNKGLRKKPLRRINPMPKQTTRSKSRARCEMNCLLRFGVVCDIILSGSKQDIERGQTFLKSKYGGEWLRPDGGEASCMSRTPVGLANHPATNLNGNYQLRMAA